MNMKVMNASHNTTLHQWHIGKELCLFFIYVSHYFRVLMVISSMRMALSPHPSAKIIASSRWDRYLGMTAAMTQVPL